MKEFSKNGKLSPEVIFSIISEQKPNRNEKFRFKAEHLRKYVPSSVPYEKTEDYILKRLNIIIGIGNSRRKMKDNRTDKGIACLSGGIDTFGRSLSHTLP